MGLIQTILQTSFTNLHIGDQELDTTHTETDEARKHKERQGSRRKTQHQTARNVDQTETRFSDGSGWVYLIRDTVVSA